VPATRDCAQATAYTTLRHTSTTERWPSRLLKNLAAVGGVVQQAAWTGVCLENRRQHAYHQGSCRRHLVDGISTSGAAREKAGTAPTRMTPRAMMTTIGWAATIALLALLSYGCHGDGGRPSSFRELAEQFERAHRDQDLDALRSLVCWEGATPAVQDAFDQQVREDFGWDIGSVFAEELAVDGARVDTTDGTHPCAGLRLIGRLRITFVPRTEAERVTPPTTRYLYGRMDDGYVLAPLPE